ncbi:trypsin-like serine peptidase [Priestia megaterium]|uniref:trypsin-like serine peptidase n=1 Tax=Priestia megaterium TaxID=1404 RepID=UPI002FFF9C03
MNKKLSNANKLITINDSELQKIKEYWTPERMKNAKPFPMSKNNVEIPNETMETPFPVDVSKRPYYVIGKIFATNEAGHDLAGTAQFVGHCHMIMTAAHCLTDDNGKPYKNIHFVRAYGSSNQQACSITEWKTAPNWDGGGSTASSANDYAFCYTPDRAPDFIGFQIGTPDRTDLQAIGYPINYGNAQIMYAVNGTIFIEPEYPGIYKMKGNPMSHGCSGGGWIKDVSSEQHGLKNLVVGLNVLLGDDPNIMVSPLFNQETINLFNDVLNFWNRPPEVQQCKALIYDKDGKKIDIDPK